MRYPPAWKRDRAAGYESRKSAHDNQVADFELQHLIEKEMVFSELFYRHRNRKDYYEGAAHDRPRKKG